MTSRFQHFVLNALMLFGTVVSGAQQATVPYGEMKHPSQQLGREMTFRYVLPDGYEEKIKTGARFPVVYLLHGLSGNFKNWSDKTDIAERARKHGFITVFPDGGDGWYTDSETVKSDRYEGYLVLDLIPFIDSTFKTVATKEGRGVAGLSMGGYGAIKYGLKYPGSFSIVGSFSGALDAPLRSQDNPALSPSLNQTFGAMESETRWRNDVFRIAELSSPEEIASVPFIFFACGVDDWLFDINRNFAALLVKKKMPHEFRQIPGRHEWRLWAEQAAEFLTLADRRFRGQ